MAQVTLRNWLGLRCWLCRCPTRYYEDAAGCGGQCIDCGRIFGWMTSAELRAVADRAIGREPKP